MPLIRLKKATPGNIVLIDFSSKHEVGKSSEKRVSPLRQIVDLAQNVHIWWHFKSARIKKLMILNAIKLDFQHKVSPDMYILGQKMVIFCIFPNFLWIVHQNIW